MLYEIAQLSATRLLFCLLTLIAGNVNAVPLADKKPCDPTQQNCAQVSAGEQATITKIAPDDSDQSLPQDVFELLGAQFVNVDVVKLVDQKTAAMLNTAVYPMKRGKDLLDNYLLKNDAYSSGGANYTGFGSGGAAGFSAGYEFGSSRTRPWANHNPAFSPAKYQAQGAEKEEEEQLSWIAKSASMIEYVAVFFLCVIFWAWFRQSKSF